MIEPRKPSRDVLVTLRRKYSARLPLQVDEMDRAWPLLADGSCSPSEIDPFYRLVHTMAGSGAFFGLQALSDAARKLEVCLVEIMDRGTPLAEAERQMILELFDSLKAVAAESAAQVAQDS